MSLHIKYAFSVLFFATAFGLAACDSASSEESDPTPVNAAPKIQYRIEGFGDFPADHANIIWYTDAVGDTVKMGFHQLPWVTTFDLDTLNHSGVLLYLYTVVRGQATEIGTRATIYVDGEVANQQSRDGFNSMSQGTSTLFAIAKAPTTP